MRAAALARSALVVLVIATFLAILYAQELKREAPALLLRPYPAVLRFAPHGGGVAHSGLDAQAHFHVRATVGDVLDVAVVSESSGRAVFAFRVRVREYDSVPLAWNGRTSAGAYAPAGYYVLRIHFERRNETVEARLTLHLLGRRG